MGKLRSISSRFYGPLLEDLVSVLLQKNPEDRPSAKQLLYVPAMQPYVKRFLLSERERADSVASDVSDISSRLGPNCSQMCSSERHEKTNDGINIASNVSDNSITSREANQVKQNPSMIAGASRVNLYRDRKLSSSNSSKARAYFGASEDRPNVRENPPVADITEKALDNFPAPDNAPKTREQIRASGDAAKARENIPASENLLKLREKLRSRYSVDTRKKSYLALANAQQRRHSEQNSVCCQPASRIHEERIHSQGAQFGEISETEDNVFAKNQATVIPFRSKNTPNVTNRRELNQHAVNVTHSCNSKLSSVSEQRRQKPAISVCQLKCNADIRTRKRHQSALTVLDRSCWPIEHKQRRLSSRSESTDIGKENVSH